MKSAILQSEQEKRKEYAFMKLDPLGVEYMYEDDSRIDFTYKGVYVRFFPYKGWFTGKGIKDGRGIQNLLKELKKLP